MSLTIKAHFDGKVIVPDEPVDLPVDQPLEIDLRTLSEGDADDMTAIRLSRLRKATGRIKAPSIPDEALRRENMYEVRT